MKFIFKIYILACLFLLLSVKGVVPKCYLRNDLKKDNVPDVTKGLTDAEIEQALKELTLSDLDTLSKLVDATGFTQYEYDEKQRGAFYDDDMEANELRSNVDVYADESEIPIRQRLEEFRIPYSELNQFDGENLRLKRENPKQPEQISVDEDYIKQLENSFPRDQNNQETVDVKKDHVRVKRD